MPPPAGDGAPFIVSELYFLGHDNVLVAMPVGLSGGELTLGAPQALFQTAIPSQPGHSYAARPAGQRFVVITDVAPPPPPITAVVNWPALVNAAAD